MFDPVPAQPNFAGLEEETLRYWQEGDIFAKSVEKNKGKEAYVIYDGPPTANAKPPLHTSVPMAFKDLVGRYQTMRGKYVPRQVGWDTHGLPVEVQVEKALGLSGKQEILNLVPGDPAASIAKFNEICRTSVWEYKQEWDKFVPRVGYWTDTERPYVTYEPSYIEGVWAVFKQIWDKDLVYKGYRVTPYCPRCGTGLSAAEVSEGYQDVKDVSIYVAFPLLDTPQRSILAWTTTPWTMPGNLGLAVGPEMEYVAVRQEVDGLAREYVLAKSRLSVLKGDYVILEEMKGKDLVGLRYQPPFPGIFEDTEGPRHTVLAADFVTDADGTGVVHTAVMYGEDDFNLGKVAGLPHKHTVGLDGHFLDFVPAVAGLYVQDALVPILKYLTERGVLYGKQTITHSYPHCWRCKTKLLYYAKDSWFIRMSSLRPQLLANNAKIAWYPEHIRDGRFGDFIKEARDWAISRERFWGTPMPVWVSESGKMLCVGSLEELRALAKDPGQIPDGFDPHRPYIDAIVVVKDGEEYRREQVVMDVWFDSGAMPYASGRDALGEFPGQFIAEGIDQTRGWFNSLLAIATALGRESSYERVVCFGFLVDEQGKKMSKSVGNIILPEEAFSWYGADAIRWYYYTVNSPGESKPFGKKEVGERFRKSLLLYWNVFNYFVTYANLAGFKPGQAGGERTVLDRWILSRLSGVVSEVTKLLDEYDFMRAGRALEAFIDILSTWYLRRSRKRDDDAFFATLHEVLTTLAQLLAPFTPFMAEHVYRTLRSEGTPDSVHLTDWPVAQSQDTALELQMADLRKAVEFGLALRAEAGIKVRQPLANVRVRFAHPVGEELLPILAEELNVLAVLPLVEPANGDAMRSDEDVTLTLNLVLSDDLLQKGRAREFLRQIQQLRKRQALQPGERRLLAVGPEGRSLVEPLLTPETIADAYLIIDPERSWHLPGSEEIELDGETILVSLMAP